MTEKGIIVKDLIRVYRLGKVEIQALRGLNMNVADGEIVSIIGPSGSGKTTLLNIIGGLDVATAGSVHVGEVEVTTLSPSQLVEYRRKTVGHIFQNLNLIPTLTAMENIELPMLAIGASKENRLERIKMLLEVVGLAQRANHKPEEMSGGEQQRIAIATAMANDPPVILADEPTGELDTANAQVVTDFLVKINKDFKKTVVMVTHDSNVARAADRILKIEDGVIKAYLEPTQMFEQAAPLTYADQIRARITDIDTQFQRLDESFKTGKIDGDSYAEQRQKLRQIRLSLQDELNRMGLSS